jgi:hypothetical protein
MLLVGKSERRTGERERERREVSRGEGGGNGAAFIYELWERDLPSRLPCRSSRCFPLVPVQPTTPTWYVLYLTSGTGSPVGPAVQRRRRFGYAYASGGRGLEQLQKMVRVERAKPLTLPCLAVKGLWGGSKQRIN